MIEARCLLPRILLPLFFLLAFSGSAHAESYIAAFRKDDPRLETRVTVRSQHVHVGDLLDELSRRTGIPLIADNPSGAANVALCLSIQTLPLADLMEGLRSLYSCKLSVWEWQRTKEKDHFVYRLIRPRSADTLAQRILDEGQLRFEKRADTLSRALKMTPDELSVAASQNPSLAGLKYSSRMRTGLEMFFNMLPADKRSRMIKSGGQASIPFADLTPEAQQFIRSEAALPNPDTGQQDGAVPDNVAMSLFRPGGFFTPILTISFGRMGYRRCYELVFVIFV